MRKFFYKLTLDEQAVRPFPINVPDIYYIILDTYDRSDVIDEMYGNDNSSFIESLQELGFYIAGCSQSNYSNTGGSLLSTFDMDYPQNLSDVFTPEEREILFTFPAQQDNILWPLLEARGYTTVSFPGGFPWAKIREMDIFLAPVVNDPSEFEVFFLRTTAIRMLDDFGLIKFDDMLGNRYRERVEFVIDNFDSLAEIPGPIFVFIHIIMPHPPYIFDANGNPIDPFSVSDSEGHVNHVAFISNQILLRIDAIIDQSDVTPVIVLQGDHGILGISTNMREEILNAYYSPEHMDLLYSSITPIITFRLILSTYLSADFDTLPDISYVSDFPFIYYYAPIENTCLEP